MADYDNVFDPALLSKVLALSTIPEQQQMQQTRMQYGREDSQAAMPKGAAVGGTYMAASPLEHLAAALQRGMGLAQQRNAMGEMQGLVGQQAAGREAYAQALAQAMSQHAPQGPFQGEAPQLIK